MEKKLNEGILLELNPDKNLDPSFSEEAQQRFKKENIIRQQIRNGIKWLQENSKTGEISYKIRELSPNVFFIEIDDNFSSSQRFWMESLYFPIHDPTEHPTARSAFWSSEDPSITYCDFTSIQNLLEDVWKTTENIREFNEEKRNRTI